MRIGLEGTFFDAATTGHGYYVRALYRALLTLPKVEPVLLKPGGGSSGDAQRAVVPTSTPPALVSNESLRRLLWEQHGLRHRARRARLSVLHLPFASTYPLAPLRPRHPVVITMHDMIPFLDPTYANSFSLRAYLRVAHLAARHAAMVITSSRHSADDISRFLGLPRARIRIIPLAASAACRPLAPDDARIGEVRARYGLLGKRFIYNVGGVDKRKNLSVLLEAFARIRHELPPDTRLVISGSAHTADVERYPDLKAVAAEHGIAPFVIFTGRVTEEEKVALLNAAAVYVYPSLYEGFGLSPLEAMQCGTPVISSNRASLPEVIGDGGLVVEPWAEALGAAIKGVLLGTVPAAALRERALRQAATFSWHSTARETAAVYAEVIARQRTIHRR